MDATANPEGALFEETANNYAGLQDLQIELRPSAVHGKGLFARQDFKKGDVIMSIPIEACLVMRRHPVELFTNSWRAPEDGTWKQVELGFVYHAEHGLPWDLVCALALVDAAMGDGGAFYGEYQSLLPATDEIQVPFCMRESHLKEIQNQTIVDGARAQKERLRTLFPELMPSLEEEEVEGPGLLQWAYACVRSRAFFLGGSTFGYIPFLDMANHSERPNAAYAPREDGTYIDVIALAAVSAEDEMTISYTGDDAAAYTSQRLLVQYGFTLEQGNVADRIPFEAPAPHLQTVRLSLALIQGLVGDEAWIGMMARKDDELYAVIKSLPLREEEDEAGGEGEVELANALLSQCTAALAMYPTSEEEDDAALEQAADLPPLAGAIRYRRSEKRLWRRGAALLQRYIIAASKQEQP